MTMPTRTLSELLNEHSDELASRVSASAQGAALANLRYAATDLTHAEQPGTRPDVYPRRRVVIDDAELFDDELQEWEDFYNFNRPHGGLDGQTPYERLREKTTATPM